MRPTEPLRDITAECRGAGAVHDLDSATDPSEVPNLARLIQHRLAHPHRTPKAAKHDLVLFEVGDALSAHPCPSRLLDFSWTQMKEHQLVGSSGLVTEAHMMRGGSVMDMSAATKSEGVDAS